MKLSPQPRLPRVFDLQKFEAMNEPFAIRVEKHKGSLKHEITPPPPDEAGWTKDRVRQLETWIVNEWAGGGHYSFAITDSSAPSQAMEWVSYYPPTEYPEKTPPSLQGAAATSSLPPPPQQQQVRSMASALPPASFYQGSYPQPAAQMPMPNYQQSQQPYYQQPYQQPAFYQPPTPAPSAPPAESAEVRSMREQLMLAREQAAQRDFERRMAEVKADSDKRFVELQQLIQQMGQQMVQQQRPTADPEVAALRELLRKQAEDMERTRREAEMREQIKAAQEQMARIVEESNRRFEVFTQANANKGPDPQFLMFQQMLQAQMEATKEVSRTSQSQFERMQGLMMRPMDVLQLAKESSTGTDQVVNNISRQYDTMFGMSRQLFEQAAQLNQGGGNEVIGLVRDIGDKVGEWAGRYSTGKSKEAVEQSRAQAEIAKANSEAIKATQSRMTELARLEAALKTGAVVQMPDGTFRAGPGREPVAISAAPIETNGTPTNGHNGRSRAPWMPPKAPRTQPVNGNATTSVPVSAAGNGLSGTVTHEVNPEVKPEQRKIKGRTDDEWFGPMTGDVQQLRTAVDLFIQGVNAAPPQKLEGSASPEECTFAIRQATVVILDRKIPIPAMIELLMEGSVAAFLDVLLPDAPQAYRDDVVQLLMDEDENEDEDDKDDDASVNGAPTGAPAPDDGDQPLA
mgnify:CR=1 FL=1